MIFFVDWQDVFHERVKTYQTWQHAQQMLAKKREAVDRWESAGRSDKVAPAKDEVLEVSKFDVPLHDFSLCYLQIS